ncbi:MAG: hypothetical protein JSU77_09950 [Fidelibacterota bacterium]|nr:MAG: hypothetical protein JSU77_09950 [Candidatus Neomarinimicrobiota bacterium]
MPKRFLVIGLVSIFVSGLYSQRDIPFSTEEYFGGGIGYTPTFLQLNIAEVFPFDPLGSSGTDTGLLGSQGLNFDPEDITSLGNILVIHGAEGFGNISGNWRIGAYVGLGSKSITNVDTTSNLQTDLKVTLMTGNASLEYVIPLFSNLEIAAGSLFGLSRAIIQFAKKIDIPSWDDQFIFNNINQNNYSVSLSGTFFTFQPYVAVKLQFLDRAGLRMSAGYNVGTLPANQWTLNDFGEIQASSVSNFNAPAVRVMLYLGI